MGGGSRFLASRVVLSDCRGQNMDAAQLFRKFSLLFVGALLLAGAANAADITVDKDTITFTVVTHQDTINVSMSDQSHATFTITKPAGASWFTVSPSSGSLPAALTVTRQSGCTNLACDTTFTITAA